MSERNVNVTLKADVAAYLEAMGTASKATDQLTESVKKLRQEIRNLAGQDTDSVHFQNAVNIERNFGTRIR
jgi:hypothetical protein